jgi:hypothetical protein
MYYTSFEEKVSTKTITTRNHSAAKITNAI